MEDVDKKGELGQEGEVLNVYTTVKKKRYPRKSKLLKRKWVILIAILVLVVTPITFILVRSFGNRKTGKKLKEKAYEDCVYDCILARDSGEIEVPHGNCFIYCRE